MKKFGGGGATGAAQGSTSDTREASMLGLGPFNQWSGSAQRAVRTKGPGGSNSADERTNVHFLRYSVA